MSLLFLIKLKKKIIDNYHKVVENNCQTVLKLARTFSRNINKIIVVLIFQNLSLYFIKINLIFDYIFIFAFFKQFYAFFYYLLCFIIRTLVIILYFIITSYYNPSGKININC